MHLVLIALILMALTQHAIQDSCSEVEVLILGAGAAGIGAGHTLFQAGMTNFTILEAKYRVGGRVDHMLVNGTKYEMGAACSTLWLLLLESYRAIAFLPAARFAHFCSV